MPTVTAGEPTAFPDHSAQVPGLQPHVPVDDRIALGKHLRQETPRAAHAEWKPPPDRPDPVEILKAQDRHRLPDLVPIRYGRMLESPFGFLRGSAAVMASDLSTTPRTSIMTQLAGDAHLVNFGAYGTPERHLVFDVNDFDETLPGPFEWDIKRLAASIVIAGRNNGFSSTDCSDAARAAVTSYRQHMALYALAGHAELHYTHVDVADLLHLVAGRMQVQAEKGLVQARTRDNVQALKKMCTTVDGQVRIIDDPPTVMHVDDWTVLGAERGAHLFRTYYETLHPDRRHLLQRYSLVDGARKVVGVGSVGTRCFVLLFMGAHENDPLFLQIKEATESVLEPYLGPSEYKHHGQRVVAGQRMLQAASDTFLGWGTTTKGHFYLRQLRDMKGSVDVPSMHPADLVAYAEVCGWALALAHARAGDPAVISGYLGASDAFDKAITHFANAYADQNERDFEALVKARKLRRITADLGL
jgi:uncharacterized protein (DUF2252 family)